MVQEEIPSDEEVLAVIESAPGGVDPTALLSALQQGNHTYENSIRAIQRVIERGLVELGPDLRLVVAQDRQQLAA